MPCGTTGESATLSRDEHREVIAHDRGSGEGQGAGDRRLRQSIRPRRRSSWSAPPPTSAPTPPWSSCLITTSRARRGLPRISRRSPRLAAADRRLQRALAHRGRHFGRDAGGRSRSIRRSSRIKDATGNLARVTAQRLACGEEFVQLSGNDDMALGFNAMGGVGCISVTANVAPKLCADFQKAMREGRWDDALKLQDRLYPLHAALFTDASPAPDQICLVDASARVSRPSFGCRWSSRPTHRSARSMLRWSMQALSEPAWPSRFRNHSTSKRSWPRTGARASTISSRTGSRPASSSLGTEVKSLRHGEGSIAESYATADGEEIWLINSHIPGIQPRQPPQP